MKDHFVEIVKYNLWANSKIIEMLQNSDKSIFEKEIINSFPSIKKTLFHILDAQVVWYFRVSKIPFDFIPSMKLEDSSFDYFSEMINNCEAWVNFVEESSESKINSICEYNNLNGEEMKIPVFKIIHHCMNHSTYHRGQIITMAKQMEVKELVSTDYLFYQNEKLANT